MPWTPFTGEAAISGSTGVYEIAGAEGRILYIGSAGARELFGLRGRIATRFASAQKVRGTGQDSALEDGVSSPGQQSPGAAAFYRYEVTSAYLSRSMELLGRYHEEYGVLPPDNEPVSSLPRFGR